MTAAASGYSGDLEDAGDLAEPGMARALRRGALPLVTLIARLRDTTPADPAALRRTLAAEVARFEADARVAGVDEASIAAASYVLCAWADEQFETAPWGAGGAGLLQRFHDDTSRGDRLLRLLARLAEKPREHRALLELFHTALSLGLRAQPARGDKDDRGNGNGDASQDRLRSRVYLALQQVAPQPSLAAPWHCASAAAKPPRTPRAALPGVLLLGVLSLGVYSASQIHLAGRVDGVLASLHRLVPPRAGTSPAALAVAAPRLAPALRADVDAGRLSVRDEALRSVVVIPVAANASVDAAMLARLGSALRKMPGKVLVVGYTDGRDAPTARTPSPWHQAMEWARGVADVLRRDLGDERVAVEARVDPDGSPPRRVEVVLYPQ